MSSTRSRGNGPIRARVKIPDPYAGMNRWEKQRAVELEAKRRAGEIVSWQYEKIKLVLADRTTLTLDFFVVETDGRCYFEEVKGFWRDDARVKTKVAAEQFPMFPIRALTRRKDGRGWDIEEF